MGKRHSCLIPLTFSLSLHRDAVLSFPAVCSNPVPHPEAYGPHNHCCLHHVPLSDGKIPFLAVSVCREEPAVQFCASQ